MNINYKQSQFELFPKPSGGPEETEKPRFYFANVTLSLENIVVLTIGAVLVMILSFSLGVERGKRIVQQPEISEQQAVLHGSSALEVADLPSAESQNEVVEEVALKGISLIDDSEIEESVESIAAEPAVALDAGDKVYTIQVASFKRNDNAEEEAVSLQDTGYESFVMPLGSYKVVCVGKFSRKEDAKSVSRELKKKYKDLLVRRL